MVLVAKLRIFCETTKKIGKIFGGLTEKRYFCHQKTLKLSKIMIDVKETLKNQVANVSVPDPRTIAIKPWDRKEIRNIEKAIMDSDVGITPENNGEIIRLNIPVPTEERRRDLVKQCNKICEKAKVEVRNVRGDVKDKLKKAIKDGLSEDNEKDAELELQKLHDKYIKKLDDLMAAKNKEIMTV